MAGFCENCPDHEACMTGYPCEIVKRLDSYSQEQHQAGIEEARNRRAERVRRAAEAVLRLHRKAQS